MKPSRPNSFLNYTSEPGIFKQLDEITATWQHLDPFAPNQAFVDLDSQPFATRKQIQSLATSTLSVNPITWIPIEAFKYCPDKVNPPFAAKGQIFRSSGTSLMTRSQVTFSQAGLKAYRWAALSCFTAVLRRFWPDPQKHRGFSLIPSRKEWPDSSLAQMLEWIGEDFELCYDPLLERLAEYNTAPVWVFATAFHYVNLYDQGYRFTLPAGSVVIETGGTKGQSREIDRADLYKLIQDMFSIPQNHIISEYGMAELACQAYDFVEGPEGPEQRLEERSFRFPFWVKAELETPGGQRADGHGALIVDDPLRLDCPWPIRSQDLAELAEDGSFRLMGRVMAAPLKGCSLGVEDLAQVAGLRKEATAKGPFLKFDDKTTRERYQKIWEPLKAYLSSPLWSQLLGENLADKTLASWAFKDILAALPSSEGEATKAASRACRGQELPRRWLVIGPNSHPLAIMPALVLGALLGLEMSLRLSRRNRIVEKAFAEKLASLGAKVTCLEPHFRLTKPSEAWDEILVFASDETLENMQLVSAQNLCGFGSHISVLVTYEDELKELADAICIDSFSLGQRGCLNPRLCLIVGKGESSLHVKHLKSAWHQTGIQISQGEALALQHESVRLQLIGESQLTAPRPYEALFPSYDWQEAKTIDSYLSPCPFVLPLLYLPPQNIEELKTWLTSQGPVKSVIMSPKLAKKASFSHKNWQEIAIGMAQKQPWNGLHEGRPLFARLNSSHEVKGVL